ncbi:MAG: hypothetical protein IH594_13020 [Bacteroidales bacterium]|nr:hypothetical protein [Bacteroidales bacterium]
MKSKVYITILAIAMFLTDCTTVKYLPGVNEIDINEFGSRIIVRTTDGPYIKGELLAVDTGHLIIRTDSIHMHRYKNNVILSFKEIESYDLVYARTNKFMWTIPVFPLFAISHGMWAIFTAPVNLIITAIIADRTGDFKYTREDITMEELKMFARFPQGLPPGIDPDSIK